MIQIWNNVIVNLYLTISKLKNVRSKSSKVNDHIYIPTPLHKEDVAHGQFRVFLLLDRLP